MDRFRLNLAQIVHTHVELTGIAKNSGSRHPPNHPRGGAYTPVVGLLSNGSISIKSGTDGPFYV